MRCSMRAAGDPYLRKKKLNERQFKKIQKRATCAYRGKQQQQQQQQCGLRCIKCTDDADPVGSTFSRGRETIGGQLQQINTSHKHIANNIKTI